MINALIIASEITKGMKSIGSRSMLNISDNFKVIDQQIHSLKSIHKNINITIAGGYEYDKVSQYIKKYKNIDLIYNPNYKNTNEAENVRLYFDQKNDIDNLLILNGNILIKKHTIEPSIFKNDIASIFLINSIKNNFNLGCNKGSKIEYIFYDLEYPWCECIYLKKKQIEAIKNVFVNSKVDQMYIFELINKVLLAGNIKPIYINKKNIMKISNTNDLAKARSFI
jgi:choline kinase